MYPIKEGNRVLDTVSSELYKRIESLPHLSSPHLGFSAAALDSGETPTSKIIPSLS